VETCVDDNLSRLALLRLRKGRAEHGAVHVYESSLFCKTKLMKEIAKKLLDAPFNWTGLTLKELVDAGRIPEINVPEKLISLAVGFLNRKYDGQDVNLKEYMKERNTLIAELKQQFFPEDE
jgi:hypothetical protein